ncbi:magnesium protoporphyrin IX methyltransferase [Parasphingopyxis sp.]|uniref:magnesium protoporphyrin IX methyltransferase n=1 Tax=Parasphingopyxis sp. TaxID=1920299 RepID=UPI002618A61D|nr:magnesium protoporphyrin IX methyltransferase [Parasphingopyxis sp.]
MMASAAPITQPDRLRESGSARYAKYRGQLTTYFDSTARKAWVDLTSDAPVSGIRATVRAGRDRMRATLLSWLPADLSGRRLLDAGCGTGSLAVEAAERGAEVVAIDVSQGLVDVARERAPDGLAIDWRVGDLLDPALGRFDHVIAMDSLIHYPTADIVDVVGALGERSGTVGFTFAPSSPLLQTMYMAGKLFPRGNRSPAIKPVSENRLRRALGERLPEHDIAHGERVASGFYTSHALMVEAG